MQALIYRPTKTAMQSGKAGTKHWVLEFAHDGTRDISPLMGWISSKDMLQEVTLQFNSEEEAVAYAQKYGIEYQIIPYQEPKLHKKAYANNFVKKLPRTA